LSNKISDKDKKDWENFLSDKSTIPNKDLDISKENIVKTKTFDFHGFSLDEANETVERIVRESYENSIRKLIVITGKGLHSENEKDPYKSKKLGILKYSMPEYIKSNKELMKFINEIKNADIEDGGSGAFYIFLKKKL
tara:strand:+ start:279 stop:692 length:414 start_codon:yes stop_codon:yes gene_type:complete